MKENKKNYPSNKIESKKKGKIFKGMMKNKNKFVKYLAIQLKVNYKIVILL